MTLPVTATCVPEAVPSAAPPNAISVRASASRFKSPRSGRCAAPTASCTRRILPADRHARDAPRRPQPTCRQSGTWALEPNPRQPWAGIFNWDDGPPASLFRPATYDLSWGDRNRPGMFDPDYGRTAYVQNWNFNLQRQLPGGISARPRLYRQQVHRLAHRRAGAGEPASGRGPGAIRTQSVQPGTQCAKTQPPTASRIRIRGSPAAWPAPFANTRRFRASRPWPPTAPSLGFSTYHSLNVILNRELANGLTLYSNWVYSKAIGNVRSLNAGDNPNRPIDYYNLSRRNRFSTMTGRTSSSCWRSMNFRLARVKNGLREQAESGMRSSAAGPSLRFCSTLRGRRWGS